MTTACALRATGKYTHWVSHEDNPLNLTHFDISWMINVHAYQIVFYFILFVCYMTLRDVNYFDVKYCILFNIYILVKNLK